MNIIAVGDIMPGGVLNRTNKQYVTDDVKKLLAKGDLRVGTLETAIGNEPTFYIEKMNRLGDVIYAEDDDLKRLVELNINVVSLANNHFFDLGPDGAKHTIELLDQLGIKHCGGGCNIEEASKPAVETINGKTIAFLAFCDWRKETTGWCPFATDKEPGVNPMYDEYVIAEIKKYRPQYDYIVIMPHWGIEYNYKPSVNQYKLARKMLESGADLILGGHTHCIQPIVNLNKKSIVYSLGNFLFPDRLICPPRSTYYPKEPILIDTLPETYDYPYVKNITYKKWKEKARLSYIVISSLGAITSSEWFFIKLEGNNILQLCECSSQLKNEIERTSVFLKTPFYPLYYFCVRLLNFIKRKLQK